MARRKTKWGGFTRQEVESFFLEIKSKFWGGVRSPTGLLYVVLTVVGVGWATWAIPAINESEMSPETYGIYVIGFLVTVMLDAIIFWKKSGDSNKVEETISGLFFATSLILIIGSSFLSLKSFEVGANKARVGDWKSYSLPLLSLALLATIFMSIVLKGLDHDEHLRLGALDAGIDNLGNK